MRRILRALAMVVTVRTWAGLREWATFILVDRGSISRTYLRQAQTGVAAMAEAVRIGRDGPS